MAAYTTTVRGIPLWLLREYVEDLGSQLDADGWLRGADWQIRLTQAEDFQIGSLRVGQVYLELEGSVEAIARVRPALDKKLLRAGG